MLTRLYKDLGDQEKVISQLRISTINAPPVSQLDPVPAPTLVPQTILELFAELYFGPGETRGGGWLVGPVGARPLHVCLLRAGALDKDSEMRTGLINGVKYVCEEELTSSESRSRVHWKACCNRLWMIVCDSAQLFPFSS